MNCKLPKCPYKNTCQIKNNAEFCPYHQLHYSAPLDFIPIDDCDDDIIKFNPFDFEDFNDKEIK
jgi:hypothetical protein